MVMLTSNYFIFTLFLSCFFTVSVFGRTKRQACDDATSTRANGKKACGGKLLFEDDFMNLEKERWQNEVRFTSHPGYEFVMFDEGRNNTYIKNGILHLKPTLLANVHGEHFLKTGTIKLDEYPKTDEQVCNYSSSSAQSGGKDHIIYFPEDQGDEDSSAICIGNTSCRAGIGDNQCPEPLRIRCTNSIGDAQCSRSAGNGFRILPPVIASRIRTYKSFKFRYGTIEIRAKMPAGDWIFSQMELIPRDYAYGLSKSGRIILASSRGNNKLKVPGMRDSRIDFGNKWLEGGVVLDTYNPMKTKSMLAQINTDGGWHKDFHTYKFTWEHNKMTWSVDGKKLGVGVIEPPQEGFLGSVVTNKMAPYDKEFYIALGIGVGGIQQFPDVVTSGGKPKPWKNLSPKNMINFWEDKNSWYPTWRGDDSALQIDYIKVYSL